MTFSLSTPSTSFSHPRHNHVHQSASHSDPRILSNRLARDEMMEMMYEVLKNEVLKKGGLGRLEMGFKANGGLRATALKKGSKVERSTTAPPTCEGRTDSTNTSASNSPSE